MQLDEVRGVAPIVDDWTEYINRILTEDVIQVPDAERVVVSTPGYLRNLTEILRTEPRRNVANYMMWRAARASVGFLNEEIRAIGEEFVKNVTGKTETPPRWKKCVGSAAGSFSAAVGKMYVQKHFNHKAKDSMLEMVTDIRQEFSRILDEVGGRFCLSFCLFARSCKMDGTFFCRSERANDTYCRSRGVHRHRFDKCVMIRASEANVCKTALLGLYFSNSHSATANSDMTSAIVFVIISAFGPKNHWHCT